MITLEFDRGQSYRASEKGILAFRLTPNDGAAKKVKLCLVWDDGVRRETEANELSSEEPRHAHIGWVPAIAGRDVIRIEGEISDGRRRRGVFTSSITVEIGRQPAASVQISNTFAGDNIRVMGVDMRSVVQGAEPRSGGSALPVWEQIPLHWQPTRLVQRVSGSVRAGRATLGLTSDTDPGAVFAMTNALSPRAGRHSQCDIVLRFLTEGAEHDERSSVISREHLRFEVDANGQLMVASCGSSPTFIDSSRVPAGAPAQVPSSGSRLMVGLMGLELQVQPLTDDTPDARDVYALLCEEAGPEPRSGIGPAAVRLRRLNNARSLEHLWLRRSIVVGSGADAGIPVASAAVRHARLITAGQRFFLEALHHVEIDGRPLAAGEIEELGSTAQIVLGAARLDWRLDPSTP